ncbi:hypothetical protein AB1Y20_009498 [Prymnesium parvum]|uniref:DJ-1/PfpI domain-containing protein n=1 Tax=Prymnesium parvum TaxID=97485 RepID=A0AB34K1S3_PRYPA
MPTPRRVLVPLPSRDFDPTEAAVPWKRLTDAGHDVVFATPCAQPAQADPIMLSGVGLWLWKPLLRAEPYGVACYEQMVRSAAFGAPLRWDAVDADEYHALLLPGGHAKGMREYLESRELQAVVARFFAARRPVGAICHGTLLVARSISPLTGKSVLHGLKSTGLQRRQEWAAYLLTALYMGKYYRTYDGLPS